MSTETWPQLQWIAGCLTLVLQPARSHGPIRFMLTSLPANLIGPCDLVADILVSSNLQSTVQRFSKILQLQKASHMINMSNLTNQFAPITSAFRFPVARFWKTAVQWFAGGLTLSKVTWTNQIHADIIACKSDWFM